MALERAWQMRRLGQGDYLLRSNDERVLWRLWRYEERDGTLTRGDGRTVHGDFWLLTRFTKDPDELALEDARCSAWYEATWEPIAWMLPTRQAAIDRALLYEAEGRHLPAAAR